MTKFIRNNLLCKTLLIWNMRMVIFPDSEKATWEVKALPMHPFLTKDEQKEIVKN